jgi:hypothetical protein
MGSLINSNIEINRTTRSCMSGLLGQTPSAGNDTCVAETVWEMLRGTIFGFTIKSPDTGP